MLVGKYVELVDAYKSIREAFIHAGAKHECRVRVVSVSSEELTWENVAERLKGADGVFVAPGFGLRGVEGKLAAVRYARENGIPFFGVCLGMQCAVVEFARDVLRMVKATSREWDSATSEPVIDLMESQKGVTDKGGTMRLGSYPCTLLRGSKAFEAYGKEEIRERHRHRYEFNDSYHDRFAESGMVVTGRNPETQLAEVVEIPSHPWFVGVQFHPEYKSSVVEPHPLFVAFVGAALAYRAKRGQQ